MLRARRIPVSDRLPSPLFVERTRNTVRAERRQRQRRGLLHGLAWVAACGLGWAAWAGHLPEILP